MCNFKSLSRIIVAGVVLVAFVGCGKKGGDGEFKSLYPAQIENLMSGQYAQAVSAVGMGTHPKRNIAAKKAGIDADAKIVKQFKSEIANLEKSFTEAVNDEALEHFQQTTENFSLAEVQGIQTVKTMIKETENGYEAYVLKVINPTIMKDLVDQQRDALTEFKATKAYNDLEARVKEYKENQKNAMQ
ncbi:MAG: hypothetical protein ACQEQV_07400 [Fibrobacterota bacterium]